jgi:hypothetical protein
VRDNIVGSFAYRVGILVDPSVHFLASFWVVVKECERRMLLTAHIVCHLL